MLHNLILSDQKRVLELIQRHNFGSIGVLEECGLVDGLSEAKVYHCDEVVKVACDKPPSIFWGSL